MRREKRKRIKRQSDKILGILFISCLFIIMILNLMTKDKKISEEENRTLTEKPRCTWDSVLGGIYMQQYESYISDQFAGRNLWRGFSAALERIGGSREENGVFLGKKKQLMEEIALPEEETLKKNIDSINGFAKRYEDMQARLLLIPDSAEILKSSLPAFASTQEQSVMLDDVRDRLSKTVQWIDGRAVMSEHADEKIYYKTDHHWTSLGAYYMYLASASELGIEEDRVNTSYHRYPVTAEFNGMLASTSGFCLSEKEEIEVRYRPTLNMETGKFSRAEFYMRIFIKGLGLIGASEVLPIAEDSGQIRSLEYFALDKVGQCIAKLTEAGKEFDSIALPISSILFLQEDFLDEVRRVIDTYQIPKGKLAIEIQESALTTAYLNINVMLQELSDMGVELVLNEFGSGYSGVATILELPVNTLKLERLFVWQLETNPRSHCVIEGLIHIARDLNLNIIAEGVETENQVNILTKAGCDYQQGFYYSPTLEQDTLLKVIDNTFADSIPLLNEEKEKMSKA